MKKSIKAVTAGSLIIECMISLVIMSAVIFLGHIYTLSLLKNNIQLRSQSNSILAQTAIIDTIFQDLHSSSYITFTIPQPHTLELIHPNDKIIWQFNQHNNTVIRKTHRAQSLIARQVNSLIFVQNTDYITIQVDMKNSEKLSAICRVAL